MESPFDTDRSIVAYSRRVLAQWHSGSGQITEAITPTTDETEQDTKTWTEINQEALCAISTTS
jgi:hypothetical protein